MTAAGDKPMIGAKVVLSDCVGGEGQRWDGRTGALRNPATGGCVDVPLAQVRSGAQVMLGNCDGGASQQWAVPAIFTTGRLSLQPLCVDVQGGNAVAGAPVVLWRCTGEANQQWSSDYNAVAYLWENATDGRIGALGLCLGVPDERNVVMTGCRVGTVDHSQFWTWEPGGYLRHWESNRCLATPDYRFAYGARSSWVTSSRRQMRDDLHPRDRPTMGTAGGRSLTEYRAAAP